MFYGFLYPLFSLFSPPLTLTPILYCTCIVLVSYLYCSCIVLALFLYCGTIRCFRSYSCILCFLLQYYSTSPCIALVSCLYRACIVASCSSIIYPPSSPCTVLVLWPSTPHLPSTTYHLPFKTHLELYLYRACIVGLYSTLKLFPFI